MINSYKISFLLSGACSINASHTCKVNGNAISNCSATSSGGLCPSIAPYSVGRQVRWKSHPRGRGVYISDDIYFTDLQRGVFDTVKLFLNSASSSSTVQKAEPWTIARCFSQCGVERPTELIYAVKCEPLNMRGCFTFERINSLSSYDKSLHRLLCKTRHCHPFALLFLLTVSVFLTR